MTIDTRTMRAIRLDEVGPPENLTLVEIGVPDVPDDGVLIRTAYAGMIYADCEARRGTYYKQTMLPWFPGREVAGEVVAVGKDVTSVKPGDRVAALVMAGGCYAEQVLARTAPHALPDGRRFPPSDIVVLPGGVSCSEALVYLVNYRIAHLVFHAWARVPKGAAILVHGAAGGMGSMILDLARDWGCTAIALVRSDAEAAYCLKLGAAHAIDTTRQDYVAEALRLTGGTGVAYSFNGVGGDTTTRDSHALATFGEIHLYGYVAGKAPFDPFEREITMALKTFNADAFLGTPHFAAATAAMHARFAAGGLIDACRIFALHEAAEAHRAMEGGGICGKILLRP